MDCNYDVIIPVAKKDVRFVQRVVEFIGRCFDCVDIVYILASKENINKLSKLTRKYNNCRLIDEDELLPSLKYSRVNELLNSVSIFPVSTGWYFQQFLQLGFAQSIYAKKFYLSWDADSLPLAPIKYFEGEHILYNPKNEYNSNYFKTIEKLFGYGKVNEKSFISENLMFSVDVMRRMLDDIEKSSVRGGDWIEKILFACDFSNPLPAFSEFETYGSYCFVNYPELYKPRFLNTFREAGLISGRFISERRLRMMSFDVDIASFEIGHQPLFPYNLFYLFRKYRDVFVKLFSLSLSDVFVKIKKRFKPKGDYEKAWEETLYRLPNRRNTTID